MCVCVEWWVGGVSEAWWGALIAPAVLLRVSINQQRGGAGLAWGGARAAGGAPPPPRGPPRAHSPCSVATCQHQPTAAAGVEGVRRGVLRGGRWQGAGCM